MYAYTVQVHTYICTPKFPRSMSKLRVFTDSDDDTSSPSWRTMFFGVAPKNGSIGNTTDGELNIHCRNTAIRQIKRYFVIYRTTSSVTFSERYPSSEITHGMCDS